jgi:hypothetical protein
MLSGCRAPPRTRRRSEAPMPSLLERVVEALFGSSASQPADIDQPLVDETIDAFVETVEPRLKLHAGYRAKLAANVRATIAHLRALGRQVPSHATLLTRTAWADDPFVRTAFAAADDVAATIGRSEELRRFFDEHPACDEATALLGMRREERQVFAPRLEGGVLRQDVPQTTVCFSGQVLVAPAQTVERTRLEIGRRILLRLAQLVLVRVIAIGEKARALDQDKAMLAVRLRMLQRSRDGLHALVGDAADTAGRIRDLERELASTTAEVTEAKASLATLDGYVEQINAVLAHPQSQVALESVRLRVSRTGIKVDAASPEEADDLELAELALGDGLCATIRLVRVPRSEMPPREDLLARAASML